MGHYKGKRRAEFYGTLAWRRLRQAVLERDHYWCQVCKRRWANAVHHLIPVEEQPDLKLEMDNCQAICPICHNQQHPEKGGSEAIAWEAPCCVRIIDIRKEGEGMG